MFELDGSVLKNAFRTKYYTAESDKADCNWLVVWAKSYGLLHLAGNICYERSGECIDLDLLELLYYTYVDCEVRRIDAPLYSPHAVLRTLPLLEHADSIEYSYSRWPIDGG
jgi:hypothetical protein